MRVKSYDKDLRENVVKLHLEQNMTISRLSEEYGISASTISRWIIIYRNTSVGNGRIKHIYRDCNK